jgi:hypothetical protein
MQFWRHFLLIIFLVLLLTGCDFNAGTQWELTSLLLAVGKSQAIMGIANSVSLSGLLPE